MKTEKKAIRYSKELTEVLINIFGDIVEKAYITTWDINSKQNDVVMRLENTSIGVDDLNTLAYDEQTLWIKFTNGKVVEFSNSEWASIGNANIENSYEI